VAKADGSIVIETDVDNKKAQKKLDAVEKKIETIQSRISNSKSKESAIKEQLDAAKQAAKETETEIAKLNAEMASLKDVTSGKIQAAPQEWVNANMRQKEITEELAAQQRILDNQDKATERIDREYTKAVDKTREYTDKLEKAKAEAGDLKKQIGQVKNSTDKLPSSAEEVSKRFSSLGKHIKALAASTFVFTAIYTALRLLKSYLWDAIMANSQARAAFAQLKGALMTLAQPLLDIVIPAFTALVRVLAMVIARIAQLVSLITGKSVKASAASAKALNSQTKALGGTAKAADKASKSMANFDEINQLSSNQSDSGSAGGGGGSGSDTIAPDFSNMDFSMFDALSKRLSDIAADIRGMFIGLKDFIVGIFTGDWGQALNGILEFLASARKLFEDFLLFVDDLFGGMIDFIVEKCGLAGTPVGEMLQGIKDIVHNAISAIVALVEGDFIGLRDSIVGILEGYKKFGNGFLDWVRTGVISILTWLDNQTNGNFHDLIETCKQFVNGAFDAAKIVFSGMITFIEGVFTGDLKKALTGVREIFRGIWNGIVTIVEGAINLMIDAINWLITQLNTIHFEVPSWVPGIGGRSWGIHFDPIAHATLPRLAQGAVIPPNREFMAVLGDQKQGTNIETPLDTMVQAFRQALSEGGYNDKSEAYLVLDRDVLGKVVYKLNKAEGNRIGVNLAGV
jgi:predicted  nucleic acid-binding Zn-ribbon protein